jgi:hypothetical protein
MTTKRSIGKGATAGLLGGVVSGALLQLARMTAPDGARVPAMRLVAGAVHSASAPAAWLAYLVYAVLTGAAFGRLLARQEVGEGSGIVWGALYGGFWWIVSGLVVIPILYGVAPLTPVAVDVVRPGALPWFAAMLVDGAVLGGVYAIIARRPPADAVATKRSRAA